MTQRKFHAARPKEFARPRLRALRYAQQFDPRRISLYLPIPFSAQHFKLFLEPLGAETGFTSRQPQRARCLGKAYDTTSRRSIEALAQCYNYRIPLRNIYCDLLTVEQYFLVTPYISARYKTTKCACKPDGDGAIFTRGIGYPQKASAGSMMKPSLDPRVADARCLCNSRRLQKARK